MNTRKHLPLCWILLLFSIHYRWLWRQLGRGKVVICTIVFKYKFYLLNPNFPSVIQRKWRCSVAGAGAGDVGRIDRTLLPNVVHSLFEFIVYSIFQTYCCSNNFFLLNNHMIKIILILWKMPRIINKWFYRSIRSLKLYLSPIHLL